MKTSLQLRLAMYVRLQDFLLAYPFGDPPADGLVKVYRDKVTRIRTLVTQQQDGVTSRKAQNAKHREIRGQITREPLRHLKGVAKGLGPEVKELAAGLSRSVIDLNREEFLATVTSVQAAVKANHDTLRANGMAEDTSAILDGMVAAYGEALADANAGLRAHTGAVAELKVLSRDVMKLVKQLDGMVLFRFRDQPDVLGAWVSARNVAWPVAETPEAQAPAKLPQLPAPQGGIEGQSKA